MMIQAGRAGRVVVLSFAGATALVVAGCTAGGGQKPIQNTQPRIATYQCGEAGNIRVVNTGSSVMISETQGVSEETGEPVEARYELVAAPPNQRSRYGAEGLALVLEGREALWMKAGQAPLDCNR